jgi:hypothetical protein
MGGPQSRSGSGGEGEKISVVFLYVYVTILLFEWRGRDVEGSGDSNFRQRFNVEQPEHEAAVITITPRCSVVIYAEH